MRNTDTQVIYIYIYSAPYRIEQTKRDSTSMICKIYANQHSNRHILNFSLLCDNDLLKTLTLQGKKTNKPIN